VNALGQRDDEHVVWDQILVGRQELHAQNAQKPADLSQKYSLRVLGGRTYGRNIERLTSNDDCTGMLGTIISTPLSAFAGSISAVMFECSV
jgi:hypothetical protein